MTNNDIDSVCSLCTRPISKKWPYLIYTSHGVPYLCVWVNIEGFYLNVWVSGIIIYLYAWVASGVDYLHVCVTSVVDFLHV